MTVLYGIGTVFRFILRIVLLPVQAVLTLLMLAIGFVGGIANFVCWVLGAECFLCDWWYLFIY